jgi:predicted CopG family antitoxin
MATKTIRVDQEAYSRLKAVQKKGESFSQVIKRVVRKPLDMGEFLRRIDEKPLNDEAAAVIEGHRKRRQRASGRRR